MIEAQIPWQYPSAQFDHVVCCGVFHFVSNLDSIFSEVARGLRVGGIFGFTTKALPSVSDDSKYEKQLVGDFEIFSHLPEYVNSLFAENNLPKAKMQKCFIGEDIFTTWLVRKN